MLLPDQVNPMHCTGCDIENSDDSRFCKRCGRALPSGVTTEDARLASQNYAEARPGSSASMWAGLVALVAAGAALMVLGGLFALELQRRDAVPTMVLPPN